MRAGAKVAVGALLVNERDEVLAISRKDDQHDFGIVGGKRDPGEDDVTAFLRELVEEVGVVATRYERAFEAHANGYWMVTFRVYEWEGEPYDRERKGAVVRWLRPSGILTPSCSCREYNRAMLTHVGMLGAAAGASASPSRRSAGRRRA